MKTVENALREIDAQGYDISRLSANPTKQPQRCPAPGRKPSDRTGFVYINESSVVAGDMSTDERVVITLGDSDRYRTTINTLGERRRGERARRRKDKEQEQQKTGAKKAIREYRAASPATLTHPYFKRKGITGGIDGLGLRMRGDKLIIPMYHGNGQIISLQRIRPSGNKRYLAGAKTVGARLLIPGKGQTILTEGFATGWTLNQATGQPVVVTFSAANLVTVAGEYPDAIIAADNDNAQKSNDYEEPDRRGTGHKKAFKTGLPVYMPPIAGMDFNDLGVGWTRHILSGSPVTDRPVYRMNEIKDPVTRINGKKTETVDKCLAALGRTSDRDEAVRIAKLAMRKAVGQWYTPMQIRMAIEAADEQGGLHPTVLDRLTLSARAIYENRRTSIRAGATIRHAAARHERERFDALQGLHHGEMTGVIVLKAPMGAGKTQIVGQPLIRQAVTAGKTTLALCHSQALVANLAQRLSMYSYKDIDEEALFLARQDGLATCLPSICRSDHAPLIDNAQVVFIDEIAQVIDMLDSGVCKTREAGQAEIYSRLVKIISNAETVVVADANINDRVIEFLELCRPGETFRIKEVQPPTDAGVRAEYRYGRSEGPAHVVDRAIVEIGTGGKVWIACESRNEVERVSRLLGEYSDRVLALTGDNQGDTNQAAFLDDIETESRRYDAVITSPVITSGVSVEHRDGEHFTLGGFIGSGNAISPLDAMQMIGRVRYLKRWVIGFTPGNATGGRTVEQIIESLDRAEHVETGGADRITSYDRLMARSRAERTNLRADFAFGLMTVLTDAGWTVEDAKATDSEQVIGQCMKAYSAEISEAKRQALVDAPVIDADEAERIRRSDATTKDESIALEAHKIREEFGKRSEALTEEDVERWADGRAKRKLERAEAFFGISKRVDRESPVTQKRYHQAMHQAYDAVFEGIDLHGGYSRTDAQKVVDRVMADPHYYIEIGIAPAKWRTAKPTDPVKAVAAMLEMIGLKAHSIGQTRCHTSGGYGLSQPPQSATGGSTAPIRLYALDTDVLAQLKRYIEARAALRAADSAAFATGSWAEMRSNRSDEDDPLAPGYARGDAGQPPDHRRRKNSSFLEDAEGECNERYS